MRKLVILIVSLSVGLLAADWGYASESQTSVKCRTPQINLIDPGQASIGETVNILGKRFGEEFGRVRFSPGIDAPIVYWSDEIIVAAVPGGSKTGNVQVINRCGKKAEGNFSL